MTDDKANEWPPMKLRERLERLFRVPGGHYYLEEGEPHPEAVIGPRTIIWGGTALIGPVRIGSGVTIGRNCTIEEGSVIGDRVRIQNGISVFGGVILESDVFVGPHVVFSNIRNPRPGVVNRDYETTLIKRGAMLGAGAMIRCGAVVGENAVVGMGSVVLGGRKNVPAHGLVYGNPACVRGYSCLCGLDLLRAPICGCRAMTAKEVRALNPRGRLTMEDLELGIELHQWGCPECGAEAGFEEKDVIDPGWGPDALSLFHCPVCSRRYEPDGERGLREIP